MTTTKRISGAASPGTTRRVPTSGAAAGVGGAIGGDTWGGSWGSTWGQSFFLSASGVADIPAQPSVNVTPRVSGGAAAGSTSRVQSAPALEVTPRVNLDGMRALLLLEGDMAEGVLLLEGDMQISGSDALLLEGDVIRAGSITRRVN